MNSEEITHVSFFSGLGGFDLAAEWAGLRNLAHCEINPWLRHVLKYYWPNALSFDDITKITNEQFAILRGRVDILTGGFPCQPYSVAGKRGGVSDERYLWPEMLKAIRKIRPKVVIGENVTGLLSMEDHVSELFFRVEGRQVIRTEIDDFYEAIYVRQAQMLVNRICKDLEEEGYEVHPVVIPASAVGAPHKRDRIWFIAEDTNSNGCDGDIREEKSYIRQQRITGSGDNVGVCSNNSGVEKEFEKTNASNGAGIEFSEAGKTWNGRAEYTDINFQQADVHTDRTRLQEHDFAAEPGGSGFGSWRTPTDWRNWPNQSPVYVGNDGVPTILDGTTISEWSRETIKGAGNAVVPHIPYEMFKISKQILLSKTP